MSEKEALVLWLKRLANEQLTDVQFNVYVPADNILAVIPMEVGFQTDRAGWGKIALSPDGESLRYSSEDLKKADVGPFGKTEIRRVVNGADTQRLVGGVVEGGFLIVEREVPIGLELRLSNGSRFLVLNSGDQMAIRINEDHPLLREPGIVREMVL
jgi:hypothetical protein